MLFLNIYIQAFIRAPVFNSFRYIPMSGGAQSCVILLFNFLRNHQTFLQCCSVFYLPTSNMRVQILTFLPILFFVFIFLLSYSHPSGCELFYCMFIKPLYLIILMDIYLMLGIVKFSDKYRYFYIYFSFGLFLG